jgi:hypothetical protein
MNVVGSGCFFAENRAARSWTARCGQNGPFCVRSEQVVGKVTYLWTNLAEENICVILSKVSSVSPHLSLSTDRRLLALHFLTILIAQICDQLKQTTQQTKQ